jgi:hypothetical protein
MKSNAIGYPPSGSLNACRATTLDGHYADINSATASQWAAGYSNVGWSSSGRKIEFT